MKPVLLFISILLGSIVLQAQIITTIAGNGTRGNSGDGGLATAAQLYDPQTVCTDNAGNLYITDHNNHVVRKVDPAGIITKYAGTGVLGYSGDGGLASAAELGYPYGVCSDANDNIYITDQFSQVVRKVNSAGVITTIAGNGSFVYSGDGGPAINAGLLSPSGICADKNGNIYIADFFASVIRKVNAAGIISTVAGSGTGGFFGDGGPATSAQLMSCTGVAVDGDGNIFIADMGNNRIRKVDPAGIISTFAGAYALGYSGDGGPASAAEFRWPYLVYVDPQGIVYISDTGNGVLRMVDKAGTITTIAGNGTLGYSGDGGPPLSAQMTATGGISIDNAGNIYITDGGVAVIRKISACPLANISQQSESKSGCFGQTILFSIIANNAQSYQWQENDGSGWKNLSNSGIYSGVLSNTLTLQGIDNSLNNFKYQCVVTNSCGIKISTPAVLTVGDGAEPAIAISTPAMPVCSGTSMTFMASIQNGGVMPDLQWEINGVNTGSNNLEFVTSSLNNGDIITCSVDSKNSCAINSTATSNAISVIVEMRLSPSITISASDENPCKGDPVIFTALAIDAGVNSLYQWKKNGVNAGSVGLTFSDNALRTGDIISCTLTPNTNCLASAILTSNLINVSVNEIPDVSLDPTNTLCSGEVRVLDPGEFAGYSWNDGSTGRTLSVDAAGTYMVQVTDVQGCKGTGTTIIMSVQANPVNFLGKDTEICTYGKLELSAIGGYKDYQWSNNSNATSIMIQQPGSYWLRVTDFNNCTGVDTVSVVSKPCMYGLYMPNGFTPNNDGKNDVFKPLVYGEVISFQLNVFNRFGQEVFKSFDINKGWDGNIGGLKQNGNTFIWTCRYQLAGGNEEFRKGTVVLIP